LEVPEARAAAVLSNVRAVQRAATKLVDIDYDVTGSSAPVAVTLKVSCDGGVTRTVPVTSATCAVGASVTAASNPRITWDGGVDWNGQNSSQMRFRVGVNEMPVGFVSVAGGMMPAALSLGAFSIRPFYLGQYAVRWGEFQEVRSWAATHGYDIGSAGAGAGSNYPVTGVTWY